METAASSERPICFIGDRREAYLATLPRLEKTFHVLFMEVIQDPEAAASLSAVMILSPVYLGQEKFFQLAGAGPVDRTLVIGEDGKVWSTNQLNPPFSAQELFTSIQKTFRGELECQILEFPMSLGMDLPATPGPGAESPYSPGDRVVSRSTPSLGEGTVVRPEGMLILVQFPEAPGKLAQRPIRCHVSALRKL